MTPLGNAGFPSQYPETMQQIKVKLVALYVEFNSRTAYTPTKSEVFLLFQSFLVFIVSKTMSHSSLAYGRQLDLTF